MTDLRGWESDERVLGSGGLASRQRVLVLEPVVEASEIGARCLGVTYWRAVDGLTRGGVRASWDGAGGRLRLLGAATLFRFGPPQLEYTDGTVLCRYSIAGGLLALRAGGSVTLAQSVLGSDYELSVSVDEYLPRFAAHAGSPRWTGAVYVKAQSPFHAAVSRRYFKLLTMTKTS